MAKKKVVNEVIEEPFVDEDSNDYGPPDYGPPTDPPPPLVAVEPVAAVKRTRRTAVQMFADEKQARMDEIAALENSITFKQAQLELAKTGLETFIADTKAALGF